MNVAHLLTEAAKDRPHHTALSFENRAFTYEELDRLTDRAASALTGLGRAGARSSRSSWTAASSCSSATWAP